LPDLRGYLHIFGQRLEVLGVDVELVDVGQVEAAEDSLAFFVFFGV
jgi:hypothetical protein